MGRCGICYSNSNNSASLTCSSCINFQMLKLRLEYLQISKELAHSKQIINNILQKSITGNNYEFIKTYIEGDISTEGIEGYVDPTVALSCQLLTIDSLLTKKRTNKLYKDINSIRSKIEQTRGKIANGKAKLEDKRRMLATYREKLDDDSYQDKFSNQMAVKRQDIGNISKQINNYKSILFQELINLYIIKRRKINGEMIFLISFVPMVSISNLLSFNYQTINISLSQIARFVNQTAKVLLINIPFKLEFRKENFLKPTIGNKYEIYLKDCQIWETNNTELQKFLKGFSRLIIDVYEILKELELTDELTNYSQLFNLDELIFKLVNNDYKFDKSRRQALNPKIDSIKEKIDVNTLTQLIYHYVSTEIKKNNNEWHVVKKEYIDNNE